MRYANDQDRATVSADLERRIGSAMETLGPVDIEWLMNFINDPSAIEGLFTERQLWGIRQMMSIGLMLTTLAVYQRNVAAEATDDPR